MGKTRMQTQEETTKRKKVTVTPIMRDNEGPECYAILDRLIEQERPELLGVEIAFAYKKGWKPNKDGHLKAGKCCKPNEVGRQFMDCDIVILLNEDLWPHFTEAEREQLVFHEMEHIAVVLDETTGDAKLDDRDRIVLRLRHHDIEEFRSVRERYGHDSLDQAIERIWAQIVEPLLHRGREEND